MPILPLTQFEADLEADREIYARLKPPNSIVVRFGIMKLVGEFPYSGDAKPGCGSKLIIRTHRGTEMGEMLTSTCPNSGCSKSVSRKEMLEYIDNSGGKDYPFFNQGRILRIANVEDMNQQAKIDADRPKMVMEARQLVGEYNLPMKVVDAEPILGAERLTFYFTSDDRIDFRDLVSRLATLYHTRIEMRQVGARDEARLVADYERCGQHCCCKQFLKVLKPVSMKSAKIQKATLDPLKISGRCGRLMCCLRYEDQTYDELRKRLPRKKSRVYTPSGWGIVIDSQILTQLVLVRLEETDTDIAVPVEELQTGPQVGAPTAPPDDDVDIDENGEATAPPAPRPQPPQTRPAQQERPPQSPQAPRPQGAPPQGQRSDRPREPRPDRPPPAPQAPREPGRPPQPRSEAPPSTSSGPPSQPPPDGRPQGQDGPPGDNQRRRRRRRRRPGGGPQGGPGPSAPPPTN